MMALQNKDCRSYCTNVTVILASEHSKSIRLTGFTELGGLPLATHD